MMLVLHAGLAMLMRSSALAATIHSLLTLALGILVAFTTRDMRKVVAAAAYISGAEVLWRMAEAGIFWEFSKYALVAIFGIALLRRSKIRGASLPLLYILLLLPSISLTISGMGFTETARQAISTNLSGPLAMAVCILFLSQVRVTKQDLPAWIWACVYPITGILAWASYNTLTATEIQFGSESIFITSGGYGPNQVSAVLGLGAFLLVMLAIIEKRLFIQVLALSLAAALLAQSFLTFSRGGVLNVAVALGIAALHLLGSPRQFLRWGSVFLIFGVIGIYYIFPRLNLYHQRGTGSALQRF